ncbi:MAG: VWA-like domain-containing protein [Meiothermus sp.]|uniref:vWA domain-containing protein n=1 Tax=Meiothermus sp. TaxID=1955249 RepID=UPI0025F85F73|nr:VWA-like domain-containing protein [Meiothermus sp.]MCS7069469.1 VWA-like domain-containing protein [Meiothermus sp.]
METTPNPQATPASPAPALERRITASLFRLRRRSPFFATLALFAHYRPSLAIPTAATDGRDVYYNPHFMAALSDEHFDGVLLHEVLHAALLHVTRRSHRDPERWNIAADIVVNGLLIERGYSLPEGHVRNPELERFAVEEVYALLPKGAQEPVVLDLLLAPPEDAEAKDVKEGQGQPEPKGKPRPGQKLAEGGALGEAEKAAIERHWKKAIQQAQIIARSQGKGSLPAGLERAFGLPETAELDWKALLWRFLVRTPTDFAGYDRRHLGRGLYLETLEGESLKVYIAVDTSGSVDDALVRRFLGEVQGILQAYPHLEARLYYADAALYGPYPLQPDGEIPAPQGGGGTSFVPFFEEVNRVALEGVCVYLTDGYGDFPLQAPELPTLWVVAPGGLDTASFRFGEVARLG